MEEKTNIWIYYWTFLYLTGFAKYWKSAGYNCCTGRQWLHGRATAAPTSSTSRSGAVASLNLFVSLSLWILWILSVLWIYIFVLCENLNLQIGVSSEYLNSLNLGIPSKSKTRRLHQCLNTFHLNASHMESASMASSCSGAGWSRAIGGTESRQVWLVWIVNVNPNQPNQMLCLFKTELTKPTIPTKPNPPNGAREKLCLDLLLNLLCLTGFACRTSAGYHCCTGRQWQHHKATVTAPTSSTNRSGAVASLNLRSLKICILWVSEFSQCCEFLIRALYIYEFPESMNALNSLVLSECLNSLNLWYRVLWIYEVFEFIQTRVLHESLNSCSLNLSRHAKTSQSTQQQWANPAANSMAN